MITEAFKMEAKTHIEGGLMDRIETRHALFSTKVPGSQSWQKKNVMNALDSAANQLKIKYAPRTQELS